MKILKPLIILVIILATSFWIYSKFSPHNEQKNTTDDTINKWKNKAPELFTNPAYSKLISSHLANQKLSEATARLEGTITNQFGIRDDILDFIIKTVPNNNDSRIMRAAIEAAQISQQIYYGDISPEQAIELANKDSLLTTCLRIYMNNYVIDDGIDKLMRNNKARDAHMWDIDRKYFSWKVLGGKLSVAAENKICQDGDF